MANDLIASMVPAIWLYLLAGRRPRQAYMAFTLDSAYQHARGRGGMWHGGARANVLELR